MRNYQAVIIGGGSAGLAAAVTLKQKGIEDILVLEKDGEAGGILNQCIHNGFGLQTFKEQLSGPAYAERFEDQAEQLNVEIKLNTMVTGLNAQRQITYVNPDEGYVTISADAVILAVGCYERSRGAVEIPGERPSGIYTAGQAQRYLNIDGYLVGKKVFILGSGDIGLIMARRMTLEGAKVYGVAELMPYSNGLPRNMKQCLEDFGIPLYLSHTVTKIYGHDRLEGIDIAKVGPDRKPVPGSEIHFDVDTLLLSVGLIPENHLGDEAGIEMDPRTRGPVVDESYMTGIRGIFACGNGLHVHDLVDFVSLQAARAAEGAARYIREGEPEGRTVNTAAGENVLYVVPGKIHTDNVPGHTEFFFRVRKPMDDAVLTVRAGSKVIRTVRKKKLIPSEMERLLLTQKQLTGLEGDLVIEVREN
ncbi:MAG: NAD(P)/FAD-dependent oxidoreductase [Solobacterium sp.]|nr:NAD(P)/FAD-dependent oxidoreductase [Solobacterium sp.]